MKKKATWIPENLYQFSSYFNGDPRRTVQSFKKLFIASVASDLHFEPEKSSEIATIWYRSMFGEDYFLFSFYYSQVFLLQSHFDWQINDLNNLLKLYDLSFKARTESFREAFLKIDPKNLKKNTPSIHKNLDAWSEFLFYLNGVCLSQEPKIIEHFIKFQLKADKNMVFFDFETIKKELISIHKKGIVNIDYVNAIDEILAYQFARVFGILVEWNNMISHSDRKISRLKKENKSFSKSQPDISSDRFTGRKRINILSTLSLYDTKGGLVKDWIEVLVNPDKFDRKFFSQKFSGFVKPINPKISDREFFRNLFVLFKTVTKSSDFQNEWKPSGYDSPEQYQALTVKRLLYKRTKKSK